MSLIEIWEATTLSLSYERFSAFSSSPSFAAAASFSAEVGSGLVYFGGAWAKKFESLKKASSFLSEKSVISGSPSRGATILTKFYILSSWALFFSISSFFV